MITKLWGPHLWKSLHSITFGYPIQPTEQHIYNYREFFRFLGNVLPCSHCRKSYNQYIYDNNTNIDDPIHFQNRQNLCYWLYLIHNKVNNKLMIDYKLSFYDVINNYESYRAKCSSNGCDIPLTSLDKKFNPYIIDDIIDCPIIDYNIAIKFKKYVLLRTLNATNILNISKEHFQHLINNKHCDEWIIRNHKCHKIIKKMRKKSLHSIENDGKWKGLPSLYESKLISFFSSTLSNIELLNIIKKYNKIIDNICIHNKYILIK
jgi:hypothetical protein